MMAISEWYGAAAATILLLSGSLMRVRVGGLVSYGEDGVGTVCR